MILVVEKVALGQAIPQGNSAFQPVPFQQYSIIIVFRLLRRTSKQSLWCLYKEMNLQKSGELDRKLLSSFRTSQYQLTETSDEAREFGVSAAVQIGVKLFP
jgi:hypothetical protein